MIESMSGLRRTHMAGELRMEDAGSEVVVMGWVDTRRDHGGLIFLNLRDRSGVVQVKVSPELGEDIHNRAESVRSEYVLAVRGVVAKRPEGTEKDGLPTGEVEVVPAELRVLNTSRVPPFDLTGEKEVSEEVRLRNRYVDLRRPSVQKNLLLRHCVAQVVRKHLSARGLVEVETPCLGKSTPEGARDYLVPSRVHPGKFYALPQSPQLFKQLLMVAGFEGYFQLVKCFRDEDLRADRQPEHTQIDIEMSFVEPDDIYGLVEGLMADAFREGLGVELDVPFPRVGYDEVMARFGSDKPDMRFGVEIVDLSGAVKDTGFRVFKDVIASGGAVLAVNAKGAAAWSARQVEELVSFSQGLGAKGLAWMRVKGAALESPIAKFFSPEECAGIRERTGAGDGDLVLMVADKTETARKVLGELRKEIARRLDLLRKDDYRFVWVTSFPLLEYKEEEGRYDAMHHPFCMPEGESAEALEADPAGIRAKTYDLVLNGEELGTGSIRIHLADLQRKVFQLMKLTDEDVEEKFGFFLEGLESGAPPHGGIALGLDRIVMMMAGCDSIRDVIAFPKTQRAVDLMAGSPSDVDPAQLRELHLRTDVKG